MVLAACWELEASWQRCGHSWHWDCLLGHPTGMSPQALGVGVGVAAAVAASVG